MERFQTRLHQPNQFKTYPKIKRVIDDYRDLDRLSTRGSRSVHHMSLAWDDIYYSFEERQAKNYYAPLKKLKSISSMYLCFEGADSINHILWKSLSMNLKSLSSFQNFDLQFFDSTWISHQHVVFLASSLSQIKLPKKLTLCLYNCDWVNDESAHLIFKSLKKYKHLQSLDLDLSSCRNLREKSIKLLASIFKRSLKPLKELCLKIASLDCLKGKTFDVLASGLISLKCLQKLQIEFGKTAEETDFSLLFSPMKDLKSLEMLSLSFSFLSIPTSALKQLAISFTHLINLHTVALHFGNCFIFTPQEIEALAQCLHSLPSSLKNLTFDLSYSGRLNDQHLKDISDCFKTFTNLSDFSLNCHNCSLVGDIGVASVVCALRGLSNLESVTLDFTACRPIQNNSYEDLKMNKNIRSLIFNDKQLCRPNLYSE